MKNTSDAFYSNNNNDYVSIITSLFLSLSIVLTFLILSTEFIHWFIIPILFCGFVIGIDGIDWVRGKVAVFDPVGFIGLFGFHFFFFAPLLFVYWDFGMTYVIPPDDWRPWLGYMGIINFTGLLIYRYFRKFFLNKFQFVEKKKKWIINKKRLLFISFPLLVFMAAVQVYIFMTQGGIKGYITSFTERTGNFEGMGWLFIIAESFPIVAIILVVVLLSNSKYKKNILLISILLIVFFMVNMLFGGLRGSRANTIWSMIWAVGIIHFWLKPISKKYIYIGISFLLCFVYIYGLYKGAGEDVAHLFDSEKRAEIVEESERSFDRVLIGDLSRTNVQSFILYRLVEHPDQYNLAFGRSYIGDISLVIPKSIWPSRPPTKIKEGTEIVLGVGSFNPNGYTASRIYGLTGEFMLNFGYIFAPLIFIVLALVVSIVKTILATFESKDARMLLFPFLIVCCFLILVQDLDNFIFQMIKNFSIPLVIIWLASDKVKV